jgi:hypothetical protein
MHLCVRVHLNSSSSIDYRYHIDASVCWDATQYGWVKHIAWSWCRPPFDLKWFLGGSSLERPGMSSQTEAHMEYSPYHHAVTKECCKHTEKYRNNGLNTALPAGFPWRKPAHHNKRPTYRQGCAVLLSGDRLTFQCGHRFDHRSDIKFHKTQRAKRMQRKCCKSLFSTSPLQYP